MDETSLFMNIASTKTIARIGSKQVVIKTYGQEKAHVTTILCIIADASKLPPILVFKRQPPGKSRKEKTSSNTKSENICLLSKKCLE